MNKIAGVAVSSILVCGLGSIAEAQDYNNKNKYIYSVKFICGEFSGYPGVYDGDYYTAINITNPGNGDTKIWYGWKPLGGNYLDEDGEGYDESDFYRPDDGSDDTWKQYYGREFHCGPDEDDPRHYWDYYSNSEWGSGDTYDEGDYAKGIFYIWSDRRLDVWAVYTADYGSAQSIDVEQVWGRRGGGSGASDLED